MESISGGLLMVQEADCLSNIMVSVVMLCYNNGDSIIEAIKSVLDQVVDFEIEVLVGDDASSDNSVELVRQIAKKDSRVKILTSSHNLGVTKNAYRLFLAAQGKYLASCEGDDYWIDHYKLKKQVDFLENHSEYVGCTHDVIVVDEYGNKIGDSVPWVFSGTVYGVSDFDGLLLPGQSSTVVRRNIFLNTSIDYSAFYKCNLLIGDRTSILMCLEHGIFFKMPFVMSAYRVNKSGVTAQLPKYRVVEEAKYLGCLQNYANSRNIPIDLSRRFGELASFSFCGALYDYRRIFDIRSTICISNNIAKSVAFFIYYSLSSISSAIFNKLLSFFKH